MGADEIFAHLAALGFRLAREGEGIRVAPRSALTDELRALIRAHKAELLAALDPAVEDRRLRVLGMLAANPALRLAVICDGKGDPLPVTIAIRDTGTCEVLIPADKFDPFGLLELIDRHGGTLQ